ncbi:MAG: outer membrane beta-barrel protein [Candidatus Acidiferrales bacterium]
MKKWALLCSMILFAPAIVAAQDTPRIETFAGYSYIHMNDLGTASLNGGSASVAVDPTGWLGIDGDFGGYEGAKTGLNGTMWTYLFGPRISWRRGRITPFAQALFGGAHTSADPPAEVGSLVRPRREAGVAGGGVFASSNTFATALGGGVDVNATEHVSVRLIQAEYLLTEFKDGVHNRQNSVRISTGVVFRF